MRIAVIVMIGVLAACANGTPQTDTKPVFASCDDAKAFYTSKAGAPLAQSVTFSPNRVIKPNSAVTMDYNPLRLNVYTDDAGHILKATCG